MKIVQYVVLDDETIHVSVQPKKRNKLVLVVEIDKEGGTFVVSNFPALETPELHQEILSILKKEQLL